MRVQMRCQLMTIFDYCTSKMHKLFVLIVLGILKIMKQTKVCFHLVLNFKLKYDNNI